MAFLAGAYFARRELEAKSHEHSHRLDVSNQQLTLLRNLLG